MIETLFLTLGAFSAAIVSGATGFGFALVSTALWNQALEPRLVAILVVVFTLALNISYLPLFWRDIDLRRLAPFAAGSLLGVPLGAFALARLPTSTLRFAIGLLLLVYGGYLLSRSRTPRFELSVAAARFADAGVGFAGGFFGGLGGLSGFLPALWCALRGWDKVANRALVQAYILFTGVLSLAWIGGFVGIDEHVRDHLLLGLPFVLVGGWLGLRLFSRLDTAAFNRVVLWVITGCGAVLVLRL
ncbi:MAG: sulfite exporter TauE/SafE family protein [Caldimonas sp.]